MAKVKQTQKQWETREFEVPLNGTSATYSDYVLTLTGPKGETSKYFKYPNVNITVEEDAIKISTQYLSRRENKIMKTYKAHIENLIKGVSEGFEYKLRVVYEKFPVTVEAKDSVFTVKNFLGEKNPRTLTLPNDVDVKVNGSEITVSGLNKERCGQVAASIEQLCKKTNMDKRVVQDGIYIIEKPHVNYVWGREKWQKNY